jgi:hypothetical protein
MTKHIAPLPDSDGSLLLRELNHRVNNELTSTICTISAKAVKSDDAAVKAARLDVVDFLHGYADIHKALRMPDPGHLTDAARHVEPTEVDRQSVSHLSAPSAGISQESDRVGVICDVLASRQRFPVYL